MVGLNHWRGADLRIYRKKATQFNRYPCLILFIPIEERERERESARMGHNLEFWYSEYSKEFIC